MERLSVSHDVLAIALLGGLILGLILAVSAQPTEAGDISLGKAVYDQHCQRCHGASGRGEGPRAQWQMVAPTNFHSLASRMKPDEQMMSIITHGVVFSPMHSWGDRLSPEEREEVLAYIRFLSQRAR